MTSSSFEASGTWPWALSAFPPPCARKGKSARPQDQTPMPPAIAAALAHTMLMRAARAVLWHQRVLGLTSHLARARRVTPHRRRISLKRPHGPPLPTKMAGNRSWHAQQCPARAETERHGHGWSIQTLPPATAKASLSHSLALSGPWPAPWMHTNRCVSRRGEASCSTKLNAKRNDGGQKERTASSWGATRSPSRHALTSYPDALVIHSHATRSPSRHTPTSSPGSQRQEG